MAQNKAKLRRAGGALALLGGAAACTAACAVAGTAVAAPALGADPSAPAAAPACTAKRPAIAFNRWSEDWSVLADPCLARAPLDGLKYLPLVADGSSWLSLGAGLRERCEHIDAPLFGAASAPADGYAIQRANLHADLRLGQYLQVFGQLIDARAFQKQALAPVDADRLDVELLFVAVAVPTREGQSSSGSGARRWASTCSASSPCATAPTCARPSMASGPTGSTAPGA